MAWLDRLPRWASALLCGLAAGSLFFIALACDFSSRYWLHVGAMSFASDAGPLRVASFALSSQQEPLARADRIARATLAEMKDSLRLPGLAEEWTPIVTSIAPGRFSKSSAESFGSLCVVAQQLTFAGETSLAESLRRGGFPHAQDLAILIISSHELAHCSFARMADDDARAKRASAAFSGAFGQAPSWAARAWLELAWNETYADLASAALLARHADDLDFKRALSILIAIRRDAANPARDDRSKPLESLLRHDAHLTATALSEAARLGRARLAAMDGPQLAAWAEELSLRCATAALRSDPWLSAAALGNP